MLVLIVEFKSLNVVCPFVEPKISLQKLERQVPEKEQGLDQGEEREEAKAGKVRICGIFHAF